MYSYKLKELPKNTFEFTVDVPSKDIQDQYDTALEHMAKELQIEGFRKGKVPKAVAQKHLTKDKIFQHAFQDMLPKIYSEVVKKEGLQPIVSPKIELLSAKEGEDWQLRITVAQRPKIELPDYKKLIKDIKADQKAANIWVPDKNKKEESEKDQEEKKKKLLDAILNALITKSKIEISDIIIEEEVNARLARLLDDIQKIGLTMESYLKSKGLASEQLRENYRKEVEDIHKIEFILTEIADKENIQVEPKELEEVFARITNEKERKDAQANTYFYASIIRKQKTLDFLLNL